MEIMEISLSSIYSWRNDDGTFRVPEHIIQPAPPNEEPSHSRSYNVGSLKMSKLRLLLLFITTFIPIAAAFTSLYVDSNASTTSGDGSPQAPFRYLDDALALVSDNVVGEDTFSIRLTSPGDYLLSGTTALDKSYAFASSQQLSIEIVGDNAAWGSEGGPIIVAAADLATANPASVIHLHGTVSLSFVNLMLGGCDEADCQMMWKLTARTSSSFAFSRVTFGTSAQIAAPTTFRIETQDQSTTTISDCTILSATYLHPLNYGTSALNISSLRMVEASKSALTAYLYGSATMHFRDSILIDQVTWRGAQAVVTAWGNSAAFVNNVTVIKSDRNGMSTTSDVFQPYDSSTISALNCTFENFGRIVMGRDRSETFISNSTFIRNSGHLSQTVFAAGGARVVIDNSSIIENAGTFLAQGRDTSLVIQNTVFEDAQFPAGSNGVVDAVFGGHLEITNSSMWTSAGTPADMLGTVWDTSVLTLNNVTITGYDCVMVFKIAGAGHLDAKGLFLSDITIKIAGLFFDRMPVDIGDDPRPSLIVGSSFTNMQGTLLSGGYTRLTVENSVFQGNVGPLLLFRDKNSVFEFSACLFSDNWSPTNGAVTSTCGNGLTFSGCTFRNNSAAELGGAIYCDFSSTPGRLTLESATFQDNIAGVSGGAIFFAHLRDSSQVVFSGDLSSFINNTAIRGGAWYSSQSLALIDDHQVVYKNNKAPTSANRGTDPVRLALTSNGQPLSQPLSVYSGDSLPPLTIVAYDAYDQKYFTVENDALMVIAVEPPPDAVLLGQTEDLLLRGNVTLTGLSVLSDPGSRTLQLQPFFGPGIELSTLYLDVSIRQCPESRVTMEVPGTPYVRCRPAICSRGCSPTAGVCIADEFCSCSLNPAFEGFDCSIPKGVNDSISLGFPTSLVPYTTASRELIYAKLSALYNPTYDVVYRSFDEDQGSALSRRSADPSQSMVVFRHSLKQAGSNDFLNSREMTSLAAKTSVLLSSAGLPPATSQVETGQLANIDLGGLGISVIAVTAIGIMVTVAMEAFLMRRTARPSWVKLLEALPSLAAVFTWAFPLTEITTPTAVSCKVQVLLAPFTLGIALPHLVAKACYYFYHMKNGVLLSKPMCIGHFRRILIGLVTMNAMYWIITITWVSHDPPVPTIVYRGSSQSRYWTCRSSMTPNERNPYLFVLLGYSVLLLGLSGLLARRIAVSEFAKNAAGQHKIVLLNVLNILGAGGLLVGLTVPQFLSARVQFIITVLCVYTIAGVLVMARAVYGMAVIHAKSDDDIGSLIRRLAFGTNQSEKTVEYTPTRSANQLIARWDAVEVEFHSPYLVMIDSDSKKGQFHELKACEASKDVDHCVKLSIKGNGSVFLQMKSEEEVASWIGNFEQHQSGGVKETDSLS